jgi:dimeric dUTPase (all-alpha-NTP-PPase superfamily)
MTDKLEEMLKLQNEFQNKYNYHPQRHRIAAALMVEAGELWIGSKGKWWSKKRGTHKNRVEELVDIMHFFLLYMGADKITVYELYNAYCDKLKENYARQESKTY